VEGAIQAGLGLKIFPELVLTRILHASLSWQFIFFGLGAIAYAKNPEGTLEAGKRRSLNAIQKLLDRRAGRTPPPEPELVVPTVAPEQSPAPSEATVEA
jgi:hypothetical protein